MSLECIQDQLPQISQEHPWPSVTNHEPILQKFIAFPKLRLDISASVAFTFVRLLPKQ
jgi:hypothetical protein